MGSKFEILLSSKKIPNMKVCFAFLLLIELAFASSFRETIDEFDNEFNIIVLDDDLKAVEEQRLKEVEANINEHNKKFANGEATYGEKLYAFSDLSEDEIKKAKTGLTGYNFLRFGGSWDPKRGDAPPERSTGLIMPPESERISSPQEELESLYAMDRGYTPRTYFVNDGGVSPHEGSYPYLGKYS